MKLRPDQVSQFHESVLQYYYANKREMPWRTEPSPYFVFVSELMLQQTQVPRVMVKFAEFIKQFPNFRVLAGAPLSEVLRVWNGLGYNRRAKFIWQAAQKIVETSGGRLPQTSKELQQLPGIGPNTAGAILAYVYNQPVVFIETNIRTVILHHFFASSRDVSDADIKDIMQQTLPTQDIREWYWALMDYGTYLKATKGTHLHQSKHYKKQSTFKGSRRQVRGEVLRQLLVTHPTAAQLTAIIADTRLPEVLLALAEEGLIEDRAGRLYLTDS